MPDGEQAGPLQNVMICQHFVPGPPREILQGGTILLWGPEDRLKHQSVLFSCWADVAIVHSKY